MPIPVPPLLTPSVALLGLAVFGLLLALTIATDALRVRVAPGPGAAAVQALSARVGGWWVMATLLALALLLGRWGVVALFGLASFAALREFATYTAKAREDHGTLAVAFFVVLPLQFLLVGLGRADLFTVLVPVHVFLLLPALTALMGRPDRFLARVAETQWALMVCVYGLSHVPALLAVAPAISPAGPEPDGAGWGVPLILFLVLVVQGAETAEGLLGPRLGGAPAAPDLSPRTWRAGAAGVGAAAGLGALLSVLTPFGPGAAALLAAAAAAMGLAGSLVLAAIKRERGIRDWSHVIPGQGGVLDQLGPVIFAAPLFFHLVAWLS